MYAVVLLIVVATLSLLISRIAAVILTSTGMAVDAARFQARSALSGVGFTTTEAEGVVRHPVRRRVIMALMLIGNAGLVTAIAALLAGFLGAGGRAATVRGGLLIGGLAILYAIARSPWVDRHLSRLIEGTLSRFTDLDVRDYAQLLHVTGDYSVHELSVRSDDWIAERRLGDLRLTDEGILVFGVIRKDGTYLGVPTRDTRVLPGDTMLAYGHDDAIEALAARRRGAAGDESHSRGVAASRARGERNPSADAPG